MPWLKVCGIKVSECLVVNATGVEIRQLFASPHSTDDWKEDILGQYSVKGEQNRVADLSLNSGVKLWSSHASIKINLFGLGLLMCLTVCRCWQQHIRIKLRNCQEERRDREGRCL